MLNATEPRRELLSRASKPAVRVDGHRARRPGALCSWQPQSLVRVRAPVNPWRIQHEAEHDCNE
jgi:hypothetical protein